MAVCLEPCDVTANDDIGKTADILDQVVRDALAVLVRLRCERLAPDAAWEEISRLRRRYLGRFINLVWEEEYGGTFHYDILVETGAGTLAVSYCADEEVPWPVRGLQRVNESLVLRVGDEPVRIGQVITSLDYAWDKLHIGQHLVNMSIIDQEIRERQIEVSDEELEAALTAFRDRRRLFTAAEARRWMAEHGTTQVQLEYHLRLDVARSKLRQQVIGGDNQHEAYFAAHRAEFDRVQVARIFVVSREEAEALLSELRGEPPRFLVVAQERFLQGRTSGDVFITLRRDELEPDQAAQLFEAEPGQLAPLLASGDGFEVVMVLRRLPAVLDDEMRKIVGDRLFDLWLSDRRRRTRVEWFWGEAEAADVPAISL